MEETEGAGHQCNGGKAVKQLGRKQLLGEKIHSSGTRAGGAGKENRAVGSVEVSKGIYGWGTPDLNQGLENREGKGVVVTVKLPREPVR